MSNHIPYIQTGVITYPCLNEKLVKIISVEFVYSNLSASAAHDGIGPNIIKHYVMTYSLHSHSTYYHWMFYNMVKHYIGDSIALNHCHDIANSTTVTLVQYKSDFVLAPHMPYLNLRGAQRSVYFEHFGDKLLCYSMYFSWSPVLIGFNMTYYCIQPGIDTSRIYVQLWTPNRHSIACPYGQAMECPLEILLINMVTL